jgi:hypothetical protein
MQLAGLCLKVIGYGITVDKNGVRDTARLVISQVLIVRRQAALYTACRILRPVEPAPHSLAPAGFRRLGLGHGQPDVGASVRCVRAHARRGAASQTDSAGLVRVLIVPHQDVALSIALLLLWSSVGASIGSAAASAVWANTVSLNGFFRAPCVQRLTAPDPTDRCPATYASSCRPPSTTP